MLTIQEVGTEIIGKHPRSFYAMIGSEFGIKQKYIRMISEFWGDYKEAYSVTEVLSFMSTKHLIKPTPACYVIRYDEDFLSSLDSSTSETIKKTKIVGTIVCIYDNNKAADKLAKYLPDNTVSIDAVNKQFISKYLHQDYPRLPDRLIDLAANIANDYNHAYNICGCMSHANLDEIYSLSDDEIRKLFGIVDTSTDQMIKVGVASRNFNYLISVVDQYSNNADSILYTILSTMLELEKLSTNPRAQSDLSKYIKRWTKKDIYNMFMNVYESIRKLRTLTSDSESVLTYVLSLLQFSEIPDVGEMK